MNAMDRGRQRRTMADMRNIATANGTMHVDTGAYARSLSDLSPGYMQVAPASDGWGNPLVYEANGDGYRVISYGSDGSPGPAPPVRWINDPYDADLILEDGQFVQAPTGR
jgi:hypothetical protein